MTTSHAERTLPPESSSVAAARRFVEATCEAWACEAAGWTATQLVSELATNAVLHARTAFTVELTRDGELLRLCVRDGSPAAPVLRTYGSESTTGRGLRLVETLSRAWGVDRTADGKGVWLEVSTSGQDDVRSWDDDEDVDALLGRFGDGPDSAETPRPRPHTAAA